MLATRVACEGPVFKGIKGGFQSDFAKGSSTYDCTVFAKRAKPASVTLCLKVSLHDQLVMNVIILEGREMYKNICEAAAIAADLRDCRRTPRSRTASPVISECRSVDTMTMSLLDENTS